MIAYKAYDRERAVEYAKRYAFSRNPLFYDFGGLGGDCTNFVSQCVLAGSCVMNYTPTFGWYYRNADDRAPAWTSVEYFWQFMTGEAAFSEQNGGIGPIGRQTARRELVVGDVIQLSNRDGDFYHTLLVTGFSGSTPLVTAHTIDALDRPLSEYRYTGIRYLHIEAVRFESRMTDCFPALLDGSALPPES
jgi:hypothetical protein